MRRLIKFGAFVTVALLVVGSAEMALAHRARYRGESTISFTNTEPAVPVPGLPDGADVFRGTLSSNKPGCIPERSVTVFKVVAGNTPDTPMGADQSDGGGAWEVAREDPGDGQFYARASKKRLSGGPRRRHDHLCRAIRSPKIVVDDS